MKLKYQLILFLIAFVGILISTNCYFEIIAFNFSTPENSGKTFRVMTLNTGGANDQFSIDLFQKELITEIEHYSPDILCLQELSFKEFQTLKPILDSIYGNDLEAEVPLHLQRFGVFSKFRTRSFKTYCSSTELDTTKLNPPSIQVINRLKKYMPYYSTEVEIEEGKWITVFNCHLRSSAYSTARRTMNEEDSWISGLGLYLNHYKEGKIIRDFEADNMRIVLDSLVSIGQPVILAGDFNDLGGSYCMQTIEGDSFDDAWWRRGVGYGATFDAWHLKLRIDHILYDHHFEIQNVSVGQSGFSDHKSLVADFKFDYIE